MLYSRYTKKISEGSLEVKLPTISTDEKVEVGRVREEKRREKKRREEKKRRRKKKEEGRRKKKDQRRDRVRRQKMQVREKEAKSPNTVFFQWFVAPEGRKVGSLKRRVRGHPGRWDERWKNCEAAHFEVKMCKAQPQLQLQLPLHYTTAATTNTNILRYTTLHYATLCTTPRLQLQLQLHYANYTTLQLQLHHATLQLQLHYTTLHPAGVVRWPLQPLQPLQKTQLQQPVGPSVDSLCHPWFTTTHLSYRFPIFETSATALCGTTGIICLCEGLSLRLTSQLLQEFLSLLLRFEGSERSWTLVPIDKNVQVYGDITWLTGVFEGYQHILTIIRRPAGVSDWKVLFLFLFLACTCSFVLLLRVFASSESRSPPPTSSSSSTSTSTSTSTSSSSSSK